MILTGKERTQFQYLLPVQGNLETLELVDNILQKVDIDGVKDLEDEIEIKFDGKEVDFIKKMIDFLDSQNQLNFQSLTLIKKFLNIKGKDYEQL